MITETNTVNVASTPFSQVFAAELAAIAPADGVASGGQRPLCGLAFSGGGIRSATFNLGIIQALSELKLLRHFDYLSTVSGGGYIGGWLSAYIHRCANGDVKETEARLHTGGQESAMVRFLRSYSNYLTPRIGLLSADALTGAATYIRNLYLNLSLLLLYLSALLIAPRILVWGGRWLAGWEGEAAVIAGRTDPLFILSGVCISVAMLFVGLNLGGGTRRHVRPPFYTRQGWILALVVAPILFSAWFLAYGLYVGSSRLATISNLEWIAWGTAAYLFPWSLGWIAGRWCNRNDPDQLHFGAGRMLWMILYALAAAALGGLLLSVFADWADWLHQYGYSGSWIVSALGTALMLKFFSLTVMVHIGLMGRDFSHESREWWSRLGGWILFFAFAWGLVFTIVFIAPAFFKWAQVWLLSTGAATWVGATATGIVLGRNPRTGLLHNKSWRDRVATVTPYIFIIGLLGLMSWGLQELLLRFFCSSCALMQYEPDANFLSILLKEASYFKAVPIETLASLVAACLLVASLLALRVDVNLFSIYYFYRQRLTRCFLGASRCEMREPHPFTGFDPDDDLSLAALCRTVNGKTVCQRPYPILNAAMNMVHGKQLAWQERRAAAFAFTPLFCGYDFLLPDEKGQLVSHYRPSTHYLEGVKLGSAMAISGAAASPNMGYHSSPALTFLMTVFNVRLGHWSGNPAHPEMWPCQSPRSGSKYLFKELLGLTDYDSPFIYLSDGGHFENLAIYELVRRRCQNILVVDAGADPNNTFDDLGNAIRKCYADFGVVIDIQVEPLKQDKSGQVAGYCAVGEIRYADAPPGTLIYIKPGLIGTESADLLNYARTHAGFPHQPTTDQWYDESQFESYRKLGHSIGKHVLEAALIDTHNRRKQSGDSTPLMPYLFDVMRERSRA
ncbi:MAG: patatin-like phospholipase family protein [Burkholderiales bacterium]|nr:patatin-like phospholipase family protein [Burkholderiales bacterium]